MNCSKIVALVTLAAATALTLSACGGATSTSQPAANTSSSPSASAAAPAPDWYAKTYGTFAPITQSGTSAAVIKLPAGVKAGIISSTYAGADNFSIQGLDASNTDTTDLVVNTIGAYKGTGVFGLSTLGGADASLQVTADAAWTISISPIDSATALPPSGTGDGVYKYDGKAGTWTIGNTGNGGNFVVEQYASSNSMPNLAVNTIGNYTGTVPSQAGPSVVVVNSDGTWTIK